MNTKITAFINKIHPFAWQIICMTASIIVFSLILTNRSPNILRPVSMALRLGLGIVIPLAALLMYTVYRISGRFGTLLAFITTMSLFALGLAGLWASGKTHSILLNGLIPVSDATNYYIDALRILHGMNISSFSGMRPFFPGFLSFLLWLSDRNLMVALGILTAVAGISSYLASREIQKTHGAGAAVCFLLWIFLYFRHHSGTTMSESLGLSIGLLGTALIWRGISAKKELNALFGIMLIALALNIRPGAMFVLPALLLWGGFAFRGRKNFPAVFFITGAILILVVFYLNNIMIKALAGPGGIAFSNFSWALYGLVSGGNSWTYIFEAHPELNLLPGAEATPTIYRLAIELFFQEPSLLMKGALHYWNQFFSSTWYNAYSFVAGENYFMNEAARWGMYFLGGMGIIKWLKNRKDPYTSLALFTALGVLASVPFVPPTDAYRVRLYAATIPFFCLLPAMGVSYLCDQLRVRFAFRTTQDIQAEFPTSAFSIALVTILIAAPLIIKATAKSPIIAANTCPSGMDNIVVQFDEGTSINVLRENIIFMDWMPNFHISTFRRNAHDLADSRLIEKIKSITPPASLFYTLDFRSNREALVIIKTDLLPEPGSLLNLCGRWEDSPNLVNYRLFQVDAP